MLVHSLRKYVNQQALWKLKREGQSRMVHTIPLLVRLKHCAPTNEKVMVAGRRGGMRKLDFAVHSVFAAKEYRNWFYVTQRPSNIKQSQGQQLTPQQDALFSLLLGFLSISFAKAALIYKLTKCSIAAALCRQFSTC